MVINSLLNCIKSWLNCNKHSTNCTKSRLNCNKSAEISSGHLFQMPIGYTNATPMPLNPSRFATIKSWAAESLPSRTRSSPSSAQPALPHVTATKINTVRVGVDPGFPHCHLLTTSPGISSLDGAEFYRSRSIRNLARIAARFLPMAAVSKKKTLS